MPKFYRTRHVEAAAQALADRHQRLIIKAAYQSPRPIWMRFDEITGHPFHYYTHENRQPWRGWQENGGVLLIREYGAKGWERSAGDHPALVLAEPPLSLSELAEDCQRTQDTVCVYDPSSWRGLEDALEIRYPPESIIQQVFEALLTLRDQPHPLLVEVLEYLGKLYLPLCVAWEPTKVLPEIAGLSGTRTMRAMARMQSMVCDRKVRVLMWTRLRVRPSDAGLAELYDKLETLPQLPSGRTLFTQHDLHAQFPHFRHQLKVMNRDGNIERHAACHVGTLNGREPDYDVIRAEREAAREEMMLLKDRLKSWPSFPLAQSPSAVSP